jgi:hypothetical protein
MNTWAIGLIGASFLGPRILRFGSIKLEYFFILLFFYFLDSICFLFFWYFFGDLGAAPVCPLDSPFPVKKQKNKKTNKQKEKRKRKGEEKKMEFVKVAAWQEETVYEIICFDDGNDCLVRFPNEWRIVATNLRGKVRLENVHTGYTVQSISEWKVTECR